MIAEELEARKQGSRRRVCFFIVDSVTLVFQQSAVLGCNIDAKVGKFYGRSVDGLWSKTAWTNILDEHEV